jgi:triphosphoribosyl-dephospho-CoA synthase
MSEHDDTLILRKRGEAEAAWSAELARQVLVRNWPRTANSWTLFRYLDDWLRAFGHARNPGTTADLVAACLFVLLQEGAIKPPLPFAWPPGFERW